MDDGHAGLGAREDPVTRCPVCDVEVPIYGPDGLFSHVLDEHPDSRAATWIREQLEVAS